MNCRSGYTFRVNVGIFDRLTMSCRTKQLIGQSAPGFFRVGPLASGKLVSLTVTGAIVAGDDIWREANRIAGKS